MVYMGGYITGSDTIAYRNESDLDNIFINISQNENKLDVSTEKIVEANKKVKNFKIKKETLT